MLARLPWEWEIEVYVDAPVEEISSRVPATLAVLTSEGTGTRLEMGANSLEWAAGVLAGLGADFRVTRPDELRVHLGELAARLAASSRALR